MNPSDFNQNQHASPNGSKNPNGNRPVRVATLHADIQAKGRTTIMRLAVVFCQMFYGSDYKLA